MTSEKDREEARKLFDIMRSNWRSEKASYVSTLANEIALIRSEAVKAEREHLDDAIHALRILLDAFKRRRSGFPLDNENEIATEEFAERILSPDQATDEKEADHG